MFDQKSVYPFILTLYWLKYKSLNLKPSKTCVYFSFVWLYAWQCFLYNDYAW